jgi:hypothetical protein
MKTHYFKAEDAREARDRRLARLSRPKFATTQPPHDCGHITVELEGMHETATIYVDGVLVEVRRNPSTGTVSVHQRVLPGTSSNPGRYARLQARNNPHTSICMCVHCAPQGARGFHD